jgi:predicted permease
MVTCSIHLFYEIEIAIIFVLMVSCIIFTIVYALLEKPSVTQDHNTRAMENSVTRIDREVQSLMLKDFSDRSSWMMEFSVTLVFWSCFTLGFF